MTEKSILRALESTNSVNRLLGDKLGEIAESHEQLKDMIETMIELAKGVRESQGSINRQLGTLSTLVEQYGSDLTVYSRTNNAAMGEIRLRLEKLQAQVGAANPDIRAPQDEDTNPESLRAHRLSVAT